MMIASLGVSMILRSLLYLRFDAKMRLFVPDRDWRLVDSAFKFDTAVLSFNFGKADASFFDYVTELSGEPYFTHCSAVGIILSQWKMDARTIAAGLMHDVIEDTPTLKTEISLLFEQPAGKREKDILATFFHSQSGLRLRDVAPVPFRHVALHKKLVRLSYVVRAHCFSSHAVVQVLVVSVMVFRVKHHIAPVAVLNADAVGTSLIVTRFVRDDHAEFECSTETALGNALWPFVNCQITSNAVPCTMVIIHTMFP